MTVGELKAYLATVPDDAVVLTPDCLNVYPTYDAVAGALYVCDVSPDDDDEGDDAQC